MAQPPNPVESAVPRSLWHVVRSKYGDRPTAFDVKLRDGTVLRDIAIDAQGRIEGVIVGLWDGVRELTPPPSKDEIIAVRVAEGILGTFRLLPWVRLPAE